MNPTAFGLEVPEYIRLLNPYVPGKPIEETRREYRLKTIIKLASNENPLGPSPKAISVLKRQFKDLARYPDAAAFRLKQALAQAIGQSAERIAIGNGSNELVDLLIRTYCVAGDVMVTSQAAFVAYKVCSQIHGVRTVETELAEDSRFDLNRIFEAVKSQPRARIVFIANPNNPTGTYVHRAELERFLERISKLSGRSVLVVLDGAYAEYARASDYPDPLEWVGRYPFLITLKTFSKIYGLAGLRVGYAVCAPEIASMLARVKNPFNVNSLGLVAAEAALEDFGFMKRARELNEEGMAFWEETLKKASIPFWPSQGNFLLVDVLKGISESGDQAFQRCLRKGVIFRPVANYGLPGALRITVGKMRENRFAAKALLEKRKA